MAAAATEPDQVVAELLVRAANLSIRRGGLAVAVEWLRRAAELSSDPQRRTALPADAVLVAARAGRVDEVQELLDGNEPSEGHSALEVLADSYRAFHADGEVVWTHRRLLDALAGAEDLNDQTVNRLANLLLAVTKFGGDAEKRERANAAPAPLHKRIHPVVLMYRGGSHPVSDDGPDVDQLARQLLLLHGGHDDEHRHGDDDDVTTWSKAPDFADDPARAAGHGANP